MERQRGIDRSDNVLTIQNMDRPLCVGDFIRIMYDGIKRGYSEFYVNEKQPGLLTYPNTAAPIAGLIDYYKEKGVTFRFNISPSDYLYTCGFSQPYYLSAREITELNNPFDKIIKYDDSSQVAAFTQKCVDSISQMVVCNTGIFESLIWCINEVMDNVLVHSGCNCGYVMAQLHTTNKHIAICVSDNGIGVYNSLKMSKHHPNRALDAISLAIQEGIGDGKGQGNGLFGLLRIIQSNQGRLELKSGPASLTINEHQELGKYDKHPYLSRNNQGTIVDFQMDLNKPVDISSAFSSIGGFDGFDIRLDEMLQENNTLLYNVFDNCHGTATRESGKVLRTDIVNTINRTHHSIILDFANVETVSSSFIDELIAKMVLSYGIVRFNQIVTIANMNETVKFLCERSVYMRIYDEWTQTLTNRSY